MKRIARIVLAVAGLAVATAAGAAVVDRVVIPPESGFVPLPAQGVGLDSPAELAVARDAGFEPMVLASGHWFGRWQDADDVAWAADRAGDLARADPGKPVLVHFWWWGDSSTYACMALESCGFTVDDWWENATLVGTELARAVPPTTPVIIVLETEVNDARLYQDAGTEWVEDGFVDVMVEAAERVREPLGPRGLVALSIGAYGFQDYPRLQPLLTHPAFDLVGFQTHATSDAGSPCGADADYARVADERSLRAARALRALTVKPMGHWDAFIASDGPDGAERQAAYFDALTDRATNLHALNVRWVVARALTDWPGAPAGCLGEGEKHLGFRTADGAWKPAWDVWVRAQAPAESLLPDLTPPLPTGRT